MKILNIKKGESFENIRILFETILLNKKDKFLNNDNFFINDIELHIIKKQNKFWTHRD